MEINFQSSSSTSGQRRDSHCWLYTKIQTLPLIARESMAKERGDTADLFIGYTLGGGLHWRAGSAESAEPPVFLLLGEVYCTVKFTTELRVSPSIFTATATARCGPGVSGRLNSLHACSVWWTFFPSTQISSRVMGM